MASTLGQIAAMVSGTCVGDATLAITGAATLWEARPGEISFLEKPEQVRLLEQSAASAVVVPSDFVPPGDQPAIQVADVQGAFGQIVGHFRPAYSRRRLGISPLAWISATATLGEDVEIHPFAVIEDDVEIADGATIYSGVHLMPGCRIGPGAVLYPNSVLYERTVVGARSIVHAGVVLGAFGFGYKQVEGRHQRTSQYGHVEVGADVEIGANTTIDRGSYGATVIGDGTKIDNQVQVGHNCRIGQHNMLCSQVGIAGSCTTGNYVVMAGQAGVADHLEIGEGAVLGAKVGLSKDVTPGAVMLGIPATPVKEQYVLQAALSKLPEMRRELRQLKKRLEDPDTSSRAA